MAKMEHSDCLINFLVGILQYRPLPWKQYFFFPPVKLIDKLNKTQKVFKNRRYNYSKWNLVLQVKSYHSKFADGRRRL